MNANLKTFELSTRNANNNYMNLIISLLSNSSCMDYHSEQRRQKSIEFKTPKFTALERSGNHVVATTLFIGDPHPRPLLFVFSIFTHRKSELCELIDLYLSTGVKYPPKRHSRRTPELNRCYYIDGIWWRMADGS